MFSNYCFQVHEKVHLGGKPYHCDMCDAKFSNKFDLYAHEKEHSDQRPHKCDMCQVLIYPGILMDKAMTDKLMYIHNDETQCYKF